MHSVHGKIHVFGGSHSLFAVGCTLLMGLDLASQTWTRLCGTAQPKVASYAGPGPRRLACSWVGKNQNTLFVLYDVADRGARGSKIRCTARSIRMPTMICVGGILQKARMDTQVPRREYALPALEDGEYLRELCHDPVNLL
jgi:hypothetical protein